MGCGRRPECGFPYGLKSAKELLSYESRDEPQRVNSLRVIKKSVAQLRLRPARLLER